KIDLLKNPLCGCPKRLDHYSPTRHILAYFIGSLGFGSDHVVNVAARFSQNVYTVDQGGEHGRGIALRIGCGRGARK
ncbi:hypothetical protein, partial [Paraburkholderia silviterrae]